MTQPLFAVPESAEVVRIALPVPSAELFEYAVPAALEAAANPGCRVRVRFGGRTLTGVIVERGSRARFAGRLRPLEDVLDSEPVLSGSMLSILREAADDVLCPLGIALAAAIPPGSSPRHAQGWGLSARGRAALASNALPEPARLALEPLEGKAQTRAALRRRCEPGLLSDLERDGLIEATAIDRGPAARIATVREARPAPGVDWEAALTTQLSRAPKQAQLLRHLVERGSARLPEIVRKFPTGASLLRQLERRGLVETEEVAAPRDVLGTPLEEGRAVELTDAQRAAVEPIAKAIHAHESSTFLLHGVTGSGKTEVYLRAVAEALAVGRQALVLVPEITLTHQILARLRGRFGDDLAVLHSGLRPGERLEQWQRLRQGGTPIAVGARSALFAPLENLGIIVIDEEHDSAYKNDEGFRYHARDLARRRAKAAGCPVVLGSATPALETRHAADRGEIRRMVLRHRIGGRPLPAVEIVDLQSERELAPRGRKIILSRALARALRETHADGGQTILLLNRRGFSTQVMCFSCGHAEHCPHCDIALVFHATDGLLRCHYCDHQATPPPTCRQCGSPDAALLGLGTQRVEEEVRSLMPDARIERLDRDTAQRRGFTEQVLRALRGGEIDVVVGTQMVAKGHDFPGVRLVGVVLADIGLHLPDFRAAERTFQLLTQVAGRAGRDRAPGRVIVQTWTPDHYAIQPVRDHDYERFYAEELTHRRALAYPPFGRLVQVVVSGPDETRTLDAATELRDGVGPTEGVELLGPAPSPLARLRGRYRFQILAKGPAGPQLRVVAEALHAAAERLREPLQASVDPNPLQML